MIGSRAIEVHKQGRESTELLVDLLQPGGSRRLISGSWQSLLDVVLESIARPDQGSEVVSRVRGCGVIGVVLQRSSPTILRPIVV